MSLDESKSDCGGHLCLWHLKVSEVPLSLNEFWSLCSRTANCRMRRHASVSWTLYGVEVDSCEIFDDVYLGRCKICKLHEISDYWLTVFQDSWIPLWHWQCVKLRVLYLRIFDVYSFMTGVVKLGMCQLKQNNVCCMLCVHQCHCVLNCSVILIYQADNT